MYRKILFFFFSVITMIMAFILPVSAANNYRIDRTGAYYDSLYQVGNYAKDGDLVYQLNDVTVTSAPTFKTAFTLDCQEYTTEWNVPLSINATSGTMTIKNGTWNYTKYNSTTKNAIDDVYDNSLILDNMTFNGNQSQTIYRLLAKGVTSNAKSDVSFTMTDCTISGFNVSNNTGGVVHLNVPKAKLTRTSITNCTGPSMLRCYYTDLELNTCNFESNVGAEFSEAKDENGDDAFANGGAIFLLGGNATIKDSTFSKNSTLGYGGAIFTCGIATDSATADTTYYKGSRKAGDTFTVVISNTSFNGNYAEINGGAIRLQNNIVLTVKDKSIFTSNVSNTFSGGAISSLGVLTVDNSRFYSNTTSNFGGAIQHDPTMAQSSESTATKAENSPLTITNSYFERNQAVAGGGAVYAHSKVTMTDNRFIDNFAQSSKSGSSCGGAVRLGASSISEIQRTEFDSNYAVNGGAIYSESKIEKLNSCTFTDNLTIKKSGNAQGGAIWTIGATITDCTFDSNCAETTGGHIFNSKSGTSTLTVSNSKFNDGAASEYGGAIYSNSPISVSGSTFTKNTSNNNGGAIFTRGGTIQSTTFSNNIATSSSGGAVYSSTSALTVNNKCTFTSNVATAGGAIHCSVNDNNASIIVNVIDNSTFTSNTASGIASDTTSSSGGAIWTTGTVSNCTFNSNKSNTYGGALIFTSAKSTVSDCSFTNNRAGTSGGAVYSTTDTIITSTDEYGTTFTKNTASDGGGAVECNGTTLTISKSSFEENKVTSTAAATDTNIPGSGGAIRGGTSTTCTVTNCRFYDNNAYAVGGAICTGYSLIIKDTTLELNNANNYGGAIWASNLLNISNSSLEANTSDQGGAIHCPGSNATITDCTISNNSATHIGGAVSGVNSNLSFNNLISEFNESMQGGAISCTSSDKESYTLTIEGSDKTLLNGNVSTDKGGAIYTDQYINLVIPDDSTNIINNTSKDGGAIYSAGDVTIGAVVIKDNTAYDEGGAIENGGGVLKLDNTNVRNNTAESSIIYSTDITLTNCDLSDNSVGISGYLLHARGKLIAKSVNFDNNSDCIYQYIINSQYHSVILDIDDSCTFNNVYGLIVNQGLSISSSVVSNIGAVTIPSTVTVPYASAFSFTSTEDTPETINFNGTKIDNISGSLREVIFLCNSNGKLNLNSTSISSSASVASILNYGGKVYFNDCTSGSTKSDSGIAVSSYKYNTNSPIVGLSNSNINEDIVSYAGTVTVDSDSSADYISAQNTIIKTDSKSAIKFVKLCDSNSYIKCNTTWSPDTKTTVAIPAIDEGQRFRVAETPSASNAKSLVNNKKVVPDFEKGYTVEAIESTVYFTATDKAKYYYYDPVINKYFKTLQEVSDYFNELTGGGSVDDGIIQLQDITYNKFQYLGHVGSLSGSDYSTTLIDGAVLQFDVPIVNDSYISIGSNYTKSDPVVTSYGVRFNDCTFTTGDYTCVRFLCSTDSYTHLFTTNVTNVKASDYSVGTTTTGSIYFDRSFISNSSKVLIASNSDYNKTSELQISGSDGFEVSKDAKLDIAFNTEFINMSGVLTNYGTTVFEDDGVVIKTIKDPSAAKSVEALIDNQGTLTMTNVSFENIDESLSVLYNGGNASIYNQIISYSPESTIMENYGRLSIKNSTISDTGSSKAIAILDHCSLNITNSIITGTVSCQWSMEAPTFDMSTISSLKASACDPVITNQCTIPILSLAEKAYIDCTGGNVESTTIVAIDKMDGMYYDVAKYTDKNNANSSTKYYVAANGRDINTRENWVIIGSLHYYYNKDSKQYYDSIDDISKDVNLKETDSILQLADINYTSTQQISKPFKLDCQDYKTNFAGSFSNISMALGADENVYISNGKFITTSDKCSSTTLFSVTGGTLNFDDCEFNGNYNECNRLFYMNCAGSINVSSSKIHNYKAVSYLIFNDDTSSVLTLKDTSIYYNTGDIVFNNSTTGNSFEDCDIYNTGMIRVADDESSVSFESSHIYNMDQFLDNKGSVEIIDCSIYDRTSDNSKPFMDSSYLLTINMETTFENIIGTVLNNTGEAQIYSDADSPIIFSGCTDKPIINKGYLNMSYVTITFKDSDDCVAIKNGSGKSVKMHASYCEISGGVICDADNDIRLSDTYIDLLTATYCNPKILNECSFYEVDLNCESYLDCTAGTLTDTTDIYIDSLNDDDIYYVAKYKTDNKAEGSTSLYVSVQGYSTNSYDQYVVFGDLTTFAVYYNSTSGEYYKTINEVDKNASDTGDKVIQLKDVEYKDTQEISKVWSLDCDKYDTIWNSELYINNASTNVININNGTWKYSAESLNTLDAITAEHSCIIFTDMSFIPDSDTDDKSQVKRLIYAYDTPVEFNDCEVSNLQSVLGGYGLIEVNAGDLEINASVFDNNDTFSSVIYNSSNTEITIHNSTFSNNGPYTDIGHGGIIYSAFGEVVIETGIFTDNSSKYNSIIRASGPVSISDSTFSDNSSIGSNGGAINASSNLEISTTDFDGNSSSNYGGAICADGNNIEVTECSFINNAAQGGSAIYLRKTTDTEHSALISSCSFNNNTNTALYVDSNYVCTVAECDLLNQPAFINNYGYTENTNISAKDCGDDTYPTFCTNNIDATLTFTDLTINGLKGSFIYNKGECDIDVEEQEYNSISKFYIDPILNYGSMSIVSTKLFDNVKYTDDSDYYCECIMYNYSGAKLEVVNMPITGVYTDNILYSLGTSTLTNVNATLSNIVGTVIVNKSRSTSSDLLTMTNCSFSNNKQLGEALCNTNKAILTNVHFDNNKVTGDYSYNYYNFILLSGGAQTTFDKLCITGNTGKTSSGQIIYAMSPTSKFELTFLGDTDLDVSGNEIDTSSYSEIADNTGFSGVFYWAAGTSGPDNFTLSHLYIHDNDVTNLYMYILGSPSFTFDHVVMEDMTNSRSDNYGIYCNNTNSISWLNSKYSCNTGKLAIVNGSGDLTIHKGYFSDNTNGAVYVYSRTDDLNVDNSEFISNSAYNGGAIYTSGAIYLDTCTFDSNEAEVYGGAIYTSSDVTATDTDFINNSSGKTGGAIYSKGATDFKDCTFNNNISDSASAGAIYSVKDVSLDTCTFKKNIAASNAGAVYTNNGVSVGNCTFEENMASTRNGSVYTTTTNGGAIYSTKSVTVADSSFTDNFASKFGGAIYTPDIATIDNSTFDKNYSEMNGGAIYAYSSAIAVDSLFTENVADQQGGAIFSMGSISLETTDFMGNFAHIYEGGAVYTEEDVSAFGCMFDSNTADDSDGGAIYAFEGADLGNCVFSSNQSMSIGGAIFSIYDITIDTCYFSENYAEKYGGAIFTEGTVYSSGTEYNGNSINSNSKSLGSGTIDAIDGVESSYDRFTNNLGRGGAAINTEGYVIAEQCIFSGNQAERGGAICALGTVSLNESVVEDNSSTVDCGGAIYAKGNVVATDTAFTTNEAEEEGGAIYSDGTISVDGCEFESNKGTVEGGALSAIGDITISKCSFLDNYNSDQGGAVFSDGTVYSSDSVYTSNSNYKDDGGAICACVSIESTNDTYESNSSGNGGALYSESILATNTTFTDNSASRGGAIYSSSVTLTENVYNENTANYGAVLYTVGNTVSIDDSSEYYDNEGLNSIAYTGYNAEFYNCSIHDNETTGGVWYSGIFDCNGVTTMDSCNIYNNIAENTLMSFRDTVYVSNCELYENVSSRSVITTMHGDGTTISNNNIHDNVTNQGLDFTYYPKDMTISDNIIQDNTCALDGPIAIYTLGSDIYVKDNKFINNDGVTTGGIYHRAPYTLYATGNTFINDTSSSGPAEVRLDYPAVLEKNTFDNTTYTKRGLIGNNSTGTIIRNCTFVKDIPSPANDTVLSTNKYSIVTTTAVGIEGAVNPQRIYLNGSSAYIKATSSTLPWADKYKVSIRVSGNRARRIIAQYDTDAKATSSVQSLKWTMEDPNLAPYDEGVYVKIDQGLITNVTQGTNHVSLYYATRDCKKGDELQVNMDYVDSKPFFVTKECSLDLGGHTVYMYADSTQTQFGSFSQNMPIEDGTIFMWADGNVNWSKGFFNGNISGGSKSITWNFDNVNLRTDYETLDTYVYNYEDLWDDEGDYDWEYVKITDIYPANSMFYYGTNADFEDCSIISDPDATNAFTFWNANAITNLTMRYTNVNVANLSNLVTAKSCKNLQTDVLGITVKSPTATNIFKFSGSVSGKLLDTTVTADCVTDSYLVNAKTSPDLYGDEIRVYGTGMSIIKGSDFESADCILKADKSMFANLSGTFEDSDSFIFKSNYADKALVAANKIICEATSISTSEFKYLFDSKTTINLTDCTINNVTTDNTAMRSGTDVDMESTYIADSSFYKLLEQSAGVLTISDDSYISGNTATKEFILMGKGASYIIIDSGIDNNTCDYIIKETASSTTTTPKSLLSEVSIDENTCVHDIINNVESELVITDSSISNNTSTKGNIVYSAKGISNISGSYFDANTAVLDILDISTTKINIDSTTFEDNISSKGSIIDADEDITIVDSNIEYNTAVINIVYSGMGDSNITNTVISKNTSTGNMLHSENDLTLSKATVTYNTTSANLFDLFDLDEMSATDSYINNNTITGNLIDVSVAISDDFNFDNTEIKNNNIGGYGINTDVDITATNCDISSNTVKDSFLTTDADINVEDCAINSNTVTKNLLSAPTGTISILGGSVDTNTISSAHMINAANVLVDDSDISSNKSSGYYTIKALGPIEISASTLNSNTNSEILNSSGSIVISDSEIASNTSSSNGMYTSNAAGFNITGTTISNNKAGSDYIYSAKLVMSNSDVFNNTTTSWGIADVASFDLDYTRFDNNVCVTYLLHSKSSATIAHSNFTCNTISDTSNAKSYPSFLNAKNGTFTITDTNISENISSKNLITASDTITISEGYILDNTAASDVISSTGSDINISDDSEISDNTSAGGNIITSYEGSVSISDSSIESNNSKVDDTIRSKYNIETSNANVTSNVGDAIMYAAGGFISLNDSDISYNTGGMPVIYSNLSWLDVNNCTVNNNTAKSITILYGYTDVNVEESNVNNNTADTSIINAITGDVTLTSITADNNTSEEANISADKGSVHAVDTTFTGNTSEDSYGIYAKSAITIDMSDIEDNVSDESFILTEDGMIMSGTIVASNESISDHLIYATYSIDTDTSVISFNTSKNDVIHSKAGYIGSVSDEICGNESTDSRLLKSASNIEIIGSKVYNNTSKKYNVYPTSGSTSFQTVTFSGNTSTDEGNIWGKSVVVNDSSINKNNAESNTIKSSSEQGINFYHTGAYSNESNGRILYGGWITLDTSDYYKNTSKGESIYADKMPITIRESGLHANEADDEFISGLDKVNIEYGSIYSNKSDMYLVKSSKSITVTDSSITKNVSYTEGMLEASGDISCSNTSISNNTCSDNAIAAYNKNNDIILDGSHVDDNTVKSSSGVYTSNGDIYITDSSLNNNDINSNLIFSRGTIVIDSSSVQKNSAGGTIALAEAKNNTFSSSNTVYSNNTGDYLCKTNYGFLYSSDDTFSENDIDRSMLRCGDVLDVSGGSLLNNTVGSSIMFADFNATISANTLVYNNDFGKCIIDASEDMQVLDSVVNNNTQTSTTTGDVAMFVAHNDWVVIQDSQISNNSHSNALVLGPAEHHYRIDNSTFENNTSKTIFSDKIGDNPKTVDITDTTIQNNSVTYTIFELDDCSNVKVSGTDVLKNKSTNNLADIDSSILTWTDCTIKDNTANTGGLEYWANDTKNTWTFTDCTITNNTFSNSGGSGAIVSCTDDGKRSIPVFYLKGDTVVKDNTSKLSYTTVDNSKLSYDFRIDSYWYGGVSYDTETGSFINTGNRGMYGPESLSTSTKYDADISLTSDNHSNVSIQDNCIVGSVIIDACDNDAEDDQSIIVPSEKWLDTHISNIVFTDDMGYYEGRIVAKYADRDNLIYHYDGDEPENDIYSSDGFYGHKYAPGDPNWTTVPTDNNTMVLAKQYGIHFLPGADNVTNMPDTIWRVTSNAIQMLPNITPTREGYTFNGWLCSIDNKIYWPGEYNKFTDNCTMTAQWTKKTSTEALYSVRYRAYNVLKEGSSLPYSSFDLASGSTYTVPTNPWPVTADGRLLSHYEYGNNGKIVSVFPGGTITITHDTVLVAVFTNEVTEYPPTITESEEQPDYVVYNSTTSKYYFSMIEAEQAAKAGDTLVLLQPDLTEGVLTLSKDLTITTNNDLDERLTMAYSSIKVSAGATVRFNNQLDIWQPVDSYGIVWIDDVTFERINLNAKDDNSYIVADSLAVQATPIIVGYIGSNSFSLDSPYKKAISFTTDANQSAIRSGFRLDSKIEHLTFAVRNTTDVYIMNFTITFDYVYDDVTNNDVKSINHLIDGDKVILPTNPTKLGYSFEGWEYNGSILPTEYTFTNYTDMTLTAKWRYDVQNRYSISYNWNGHKPATYPEDSLNIIPGSAVVITCPDKQATNYVATYALYKDGTKITDPFTSNLAIKSIDADYVVEATWKADVNNNGIPDEDEAGWITLESPKDLTGIITAEELINKYGYLDCTISGSNIKVKVLPGLSCGVFPYIEFSDGYVGTWKINSTTYNSSEQVPAWDGTTTTYTGIFTPNVVKTYSVTFEGLDGAVNVPTNMTDITSGSHVQIILGSKLSGSGNTITVATPTKDDYEFKGWTSNVDFGYGTSFNPTNGWLDVPSYPDKDIVLTAVWEYVGEDPDIDDPFHPSVGSSRG